MKRHIIILLATLCVNAIFADTFNYKFNSARLSDALDKIAEEHPSLILNFIYNELDNYTTSARIHTDNPYEALRQTIGLNPVSVTKKENRFYIEAMQHGKFRYTGRAVGNDKEPIVAATVMLLAPKDSTVITYGITDYNGYFSIPCDHQGVIGKFSCIGYKTVFHKFSSFSVGTIVIPEKVVALGEIKVEGDNAVLYADKSVYLPTSKQKNASQTGADLLSHMAIPQLNMSTNNITTNSGKPVATFIDYVPASDNDLKAMRIADVKKVEYYENPSDPRLQGNTYVVNFIMQKYEFGGYVKSFAHTNFISNPVIDGLGNVRLQYKKMTYDIMGSVSHYDRRHIGSELTETFRLPQESGEIKEFTRYSTTTSSKETGNWYFATFRATYNTDNIQAVSQINGRIDRQPENMRKGSVSYTPDVFPNTEYSSNSDERTKYIAYNGYYFFSLPNSNSFTFTSEYSFSHTFQNSFYSEDGYKPIYNGANDNTNQLKANLKFKHDFGKFGNLLGIVKGSYEYNRTGYSGSATALDKAKSSRIGMAVNYDITIDNLYGQIGFGWDWDRLRFGNMTDCPSSPTFDISLQYAINRKHSFSGRFGYESWLPSPSFKSDKIIESSPLLSYTGNPNLVPGKSYDFDLNYTWVPNNNCSLNAYAWAWIVGDRYVYDYEATSTGVLRTIKQPMGSYAQGMYGLKGNIMFLDKSLVFTGHVGQIINHNGKPYDVNHSFINWYVRAAYYIGSWTFRITYVADSASADGCMNGKWHHGKNSWYISCIWGNDKWNVRGDLFNFTRWNWRSAYQDMRSKYYDTHEVFLNGDNRAFIQLSATYTFGFGKKVHRSDQPSVSGSASSGILK